MGISKWNAGIIRPVPVAPAGPYENGAAPGVWTLDQVAYWQKQGLWPIAGNAPNYIEDVFSTYLYTGNGSTQTITNGINLSGKGGLVWIKDRTATPFHVLTDTTRGVNSQLYTNSTADANSNTSGVTAFNSNGFNIGSWTFVNTASDNLVSWTFREQPKFFDIVTYTGTGVASRAISHNLGSVPGMMIVKQTNAVQNWPVYHRSVPTGTGYLNSTQQFFTGAGNGVWGDAAYNNIAPTSTVFYVGSDAEVNASGGTYVAYLFAHDAGGFGLTGTDNVISCGTFTTDGTGAAGNITLGYEAQWLLIKRSDGVGSWNIIDVMRGSSLTSYNYLQPNASTQESSSTSAGQGIFPTATGFFVGTNFPAASANYIYIAIRRGPMKTPTLGTTVFEPAIYTGNTPEPGRVFTSSITVDAILNTSRAQTADPNNRVLIPRLIGTGGLFTTKTDAESASQNVAWDYQTGYKAPTLTSDPWNNNGSTYVSYRFKRAPGFFDEVCYTGNNVDNRTIPHNLTVAPELTIIKMRSGDTTRGWRTYTPNAIGSAKWGMLNLTNAFESAAYIPSVSSTTITLSSDAEVNRSACNYVAYLFATCAGVSKVGSYTGTGALQTVACGFTSGARFVLIKRTDSTGDWYVWDSARGITSGNDPYLQINNTAAEVTNTNYVDTDTTGFKVTAAAPAGINANGGTYIFLAIA